MNKRFSALPTTIFLYAILSIFWLPAAANAQKGMPVPMGIFNVLQKFDPLEIRIETDVKRLKSNAEAKQWQPAVFKVMMDDSIALQLDIQICTRGNMRLKTCEFPPLKLRFYGAESISDSLADINELKFVSSCKDSPQNEEWVKREYLLYQTYNTLTEQSFRVKSAKIRISEPGKKRAYIQGFSFFIESERELASRLNGTPIKAKSVFLNTFDSMAYDRMALFQYMIANTDWSASNRHNVKAILLKETQSIVAIPYDFDYAGTINTDYAVPNTKKISTVKERYFIGRCRSEAHYQSLFAFFKTHEKDLMECCSKANYLNRTSQYEIKQFWREFFEIIDDKDRYMKEIVRHCK